MPILLFSTDGAYRAGVFDDDSPEARQRLQRSARPGDTLTVCDCDGLAHVAGADGALRCPRLILSVHFRADREPEIARGPAFSA